MKRQLGASKSGVVVTDVLRPLWLLPPWLKSSLDDQVTCLAVDLDRPRSLVTQGMSLHTVRLRIGSRPHVDTIEVVRDMSMGAGPRCPGTHMMCRTLRMITDAIPTRDILIDVMSVGRLVLRDVHAAATAMAAGKADQLRRWLCRSRRQAACPVLVMPCLKGSCLDNRRTCLVICAPLASHVTSLTV